LSIPKRIGFIGLGVMGAPMAARLIGAGYPVVAYHHRLQKVEALASLGADFAPSPLELARRCDRVILMVRYSSAVEELVLGPSGLMGELSAGSVLVDMGSSIPSSTQRIASLLEDRGVEMLDAPVAGGPEGAERGTLTIMVGGKDHVFQACLPMFEAMGKRIFHAGGQSGAAVPYHMVATPHIGDSHMVTEAAILAALLRLVDRIPMPTPSNHQGRPKTYPDRLFLKALVIMVVKHLPKAHSLLAVLEEPKMQPLRDLLVESGRYPTRRTFERRLRAMPETLPAQIACLGRHLLVLIDPFQDCGRVAAIDSMVLAAKGGVWHKKHREAGVVPHISIDTEAGWKRVAGTAGSAAGSCIWSPRWPPSGSPRSWSRESYHALGLPSRGEAFWG